MVTQRLTGSNGLRESQFFLLKHWFPLPEVLPFSSSSTSSSGFLLRSQRGLHSSAWRCFRWCCGPCHTSPPPSTLLHPPPPAPQDTCISLSIQCQTSCTGFLICTASSLSLDSLISHWRKESSVISLPVSTACNSGMVSCSLTSAPGLCWPVVLVELLWLLCEDTAWLSSKLTGSMAVSCSSRPWVWL